MTTTAAQVSAKVRAAMHERQIAATAMATALDMSVSTLRRRLAGTSRHFTVDEIAAAADYMGVPVEFLLAAEPSAEIADGWVIVREGATERRWPTRFAPAKWLHLDEWSSLEAVARARQILDAEAALEDIGYQVIELCSGARPGYRSTPPMVRAMAAIEDVHGVLHAQLIELRNAHCPRPEPSLMAALLDRSTAASGKQ